MFCFIFQELLSEIQVNLNSTNRGEHLNEKIEQQLTQLVQIETDPSFMLVSHVASYLPLGLLSFTQNVS